MKSISYLLKNKSWKIAFFLTLLPAFSQADPGNQYCITPPFITAGIKPNLLLMIDNSASMYDLAYQDTSNKYCANNPTTQCTADSQCASAGQAFCVGSYASSGGTASKAACTTDADCQRIVPGDTCVLTGPKSSRNLCTTATVTTAITLSPIACSANSGCTSSGGTCPAGSTCTWAADDICNNTCSASRQCYDTTYTPYTTTSNYYGYFDAAATYSYDFTNNKFTSGASMPGSCTYSAGTPAYFCVNTTGTGAAEAVVGDSTGFVVSGNFLNWLTASKFDQEKKILTGGKFDTSANVLVSETRGCGGREFLKSVSGVNLTFAIHGGTPAGVGTTQNLSTEYGQTYIEIYAGTYNATDCLKATNDWSKVASGVNVNLGTFSGDTKGCVGAGSSSINATDIWNHALHNCYQGMTGGAQGYSTNLNTLQGDCKNIYATIRPDQITDPNSGYSICSSVLTYTINGTSYTGYLGACWNGTDFNGPCSPNVLAQMENYCQVNVKTNPIADPSSTAVTTSTATASIPGFVMQQGLNNLTRVGSFKANVALAAPPSGLVDKYGSRIRLGAISFQNNGSGSECGSTSLPCTKACYSAGTGFTTRMCIASTDCPTGSGQTCEPLPKTDGGQLISYVGAGKCSVTTTTSCDVDSDCPSGEYCQPSVGNHSSGLINSIDAIPATSWTPFAEAFYNAMGYFARTNNYGTNPPTSRDFNFSVLGPNTATSYNTSKNPSQFRCQSNNILLITDGMSTADRHTVSEGLATQYASAVPYTIGTTTYRPGDVGYDATNVYGGSTCPTYSGSRSISDLAWVAKNRNIKTLVTSGTASTAAPQNSSESITTYVVYSGQETSSQTGLCDPKTLMQNTAKNGGTTLFSAADPQSLYNQIDAAFSSVAAKAASGTAASILSNSEGSGANILQAVFYPQKIFANDTSVNWIGEMQNLWYYVDPYINNSTIREDTDGDLKLKLTQDYVTSFYFDNSADKTMVQRYQDTNGDGAGDTAIGSPIDPDFVKSIWRAGKLLWSRNITTTGTNPDPRKIKTTLNGTSLIDFSSSTYPGGSVTDNSTALAPYLNVTAAQAPTLINWVHGEDYPNDSTLRRRRVDIKDPSPATTVSSGIWRLGDIISSTPRSSRRSA
ncbi:hypothetical protein [Geotalea toluenoxydans]|uniref:hypothetical protein n=1 Tax=Geotalea toluenoxydans TaxID=421624 RepID=UPI0006D147F9|nr:hypothetical protein [Geotalea toluenoxydans]